MSTRHPGTQHLLQLLEVNPNLKGMAYEVSSTCYEVAKEMCAYLQDGMELTAGLRKLLEAKDCFVRQSILDEREAKQ